MHAPSWTITYYHDLKTGRANHMHAWLTNRLNRSWHEHAYWNRNKHLMSRQSILLPVYNAHLQKGCPTTAMLCRLEGLQKTPHFI